MSALDIKKPYYSLKLDADIVPYVVVLNGIELERDLKGNSNHSSYPINQWIRNGENSLELMYPPAAILANRADKDAICKASIIVNGYVNGEEVEYTVVTLAFTTQLKTLEEFHEGSSETGSYIFKNGKTLPTENKEEPDTIVSSIQLLPTYGGESGADGGRLSRTFTAKVPFPEWEFFSGDVIFKVSAKPTIPFFLDLSPR